MKPVLWMAFVIATAPGSAWGLTASQKSLYKGLCGVDATRATVPQPNYSNALVKDAARQLSKIHPSSFALYEDFNSVYGLEGSLEKPGWVKPAAHQFIVVLCGEYRDYPEMLKRKLEWARDISIVANEKQGYDPEMGIWEQLTGKGYKRLVSLSADLYRYREAALSGETGLDAQVVSGITACEYRYILAHYLIEGVDPGLDSEEEFQEYQKGLKQWGQGEENCTAEEKETFYEFRGDGNLKPQTLESNGLIWYSRFFSKGCESLTRAQEGGLLSDADCKAYFSAPFTRRDHYTSQGLSRLLFYPETQKMEAIMKDYGASQIFVTEDLDEDGVADLLYLAPRDCVDRPLQAGCMAELAREVGADLRKKKMWSSSETAIQILLYTLVRAAHEQLSGSPLKGAFVHLGEVLKEKIPTELKTVEKKIKSAPDKSVLKEYQKLLVSAEQILDGQWNAKGVVLMTELHSRFNLSFLKKKDLGFSEVFSTKKAAWDRLATVLDRHTDWYQTDMVHLQMGQYSPVFSPWVASSYYIDASHAFTKPGYARGLPGDGHMHWRYVQRVLKKDWFNVAQMKLQWPRSIDIYNTWFDETTFSRSSLGAEERAWDRYGYVAPEEMEIALWLYEVPQF